MTAAIARMNLVLHGVENYQIARGDTLERPAFTDRDSLAKFDVVLANPPCSIKQWNRDGWQSDPWGRSTDILPKCFTLKVNEFCLMQVYFTSEKLHALCSSSKELTRRYGAENAKAIAKRLDNLRFAANLEVMTTLPGRLHELTGDRAEAFALDLKHGYRLIIKSSDDPPPRKPDGGLDLKAIQAVDVIAIEDYHD